MKMPVQKRACQENVLFLDRAGRTQALENTIVNQQVGCQRCLEPVCQRCLECCLEDDMQPVRVIQFVVVIGCVGFAFSGIQTRKSDKDQQLTGRNI